jgi:hypothetical protein
MNDPLYAFVRYRPLGWVVIVVCVALLYWQGDGGNPSW